MAKKLTDEDVRALRFEINTLFTPSSPVQLAELFAGRRKQIGQLLDAVAEPGRHAIVYGERGVGKTSLAKVLELLVPSGLQRLAYQRKPCDPNDDFTSIWKKFFTDMHFKIGEETYSVDEVYPESITPYDVLRELKRFGANDIPIFVIDEFNEIQDPETPNLLANTIKALSDDTVNATVVVVGVGENVSELFSEHESIDRCSEEIPMPRMSKEELEELLDKRLAQLGMSITGDAKWKIIVLSRGLPTYTHRLGKHAALRSVELRRLRIEEVDVDFAIDEMLQGSLRSLRDKYEQATASNQPGNLFKQVLLACGLAKADDNGYFKPAAIAEPLSGLVGRSMAIANYQNHLSAFISEERGRILQRIGGERSFMFRFRDPAMLPYVIMKGLRAGLIKQDVKSVLSYPEQPELFSNE